MLTAHMDEVGFAVQSVTKQGFIKFVALGSWWTHTLLAQRVRILTASGREIPGVIGSTPPHFLTDAQRSNVLPVEQLFIDVGAGSREEAMEEFGIQLGDPIVPFSEFTPMANPHLYMSKAFDNRVGCAAMVQAVQAVHGEKLGCTVVAVGTVQEEVGCRGAVPAAHLARPDVAIILEGTPADDAPNAEAEAQGVLGKGPQVRLLDPSALMHRPLVEFVLKTARKEKIAHQVAVRRGGGTDAKSIQLAHDGVPCVVIGVPARYIHSHHSIIDLRDYLATVKLATALLRRLDARQVERLRSW
jgi:endoglucanase